MTLGTGSAHRTKVDQCGQVVCVIPRDLYRRKKRKIIPTSDDLEQLIFEHVVESNFG